MTPREFIDFLGLISPLKTTPRHNWTEPGRRESVADHCFRLALAPMLLEGEFPELDIGKVIKMCLIHDLGEAVTGDIPCFSKTESDEQTERLAVEGLLSHLSEDVRENFRALYLEIEECRTPEAKLFKALDSLEAVISHNEADISTWEPHEYALQLRHGADRVGWSEWLTALKAEIDRDTLRKIESEGSDN